MTASLARSCSIISRNLWASGCKTFGLKSNSLPAISSLNRFYYTYSPEPFQPLHNRKPEWLSADDAITCVQSNDKIYVHAVAATPEPLLNSLCKYAKSSDLKNVMLYHLHLTGEAPWADPSYEGIIRSTCFHISDNLRAAVNEGRADCVSVFLSEIPLIFKRRFIELDVALIQCSTPDHQVIAQTCSGRWKSRTR